MTKPFDVLASSATLVQSARSVRSKVKGCAWKFMAIVRGRIEDMSMCRSACSSCGPELQKAVANQPFA